MAVMNHAAGGHQAIRLDHSYSENDFLGLHSMLRSLGIRPPRRSTALEDRKDKDDTNDMKDMQHMNDWNEYIYIYIYE